MAALEPIPVFTQLNDLYGNLGTTIDHAANWNTLAEEFQKRFGKKPAYIARAPGRVKCVLFITVFCEHIDYCLFGVLPAAIERDILIACAPKTHGDPGYVVADNLQDKYTKQAFKPSPNRKDSVSSISSIDDEQVHAEEWHLEINTAELRWESYVKAGYYGVLTNYFPSSNSLAQPIPVDLLVTGTVPAGSGLSSSAAMVVASTLAFLAVNGKLDVNIAKNGSKKISKGDLVKLAVANENRVGKMDQAASVICTPSSALYISFFPTLFASPVPLPSGAVFVCANSMVISDKAVGARKGYNLRVVETLVGARVLARQLGLPLGEGEKITLREVAGRLVGETADQEMSIEKLSEVLERMDMEVDGLKPVGRDEGEELGVTMEEMIRMSGLSEEEFHEIYLSWVTVEATHFQLYKRAKHVFSEALRVLKFRQVCLDAALSPSETVIQALGDLMNESQTSCRDLYECSCPELDELTRLAREAGAVASRLTGAGWGGCTVSLVPEGLVAAFIQKVKDTYPPYQALKGEKLNEVIFATKPSSGACVYKFDD
ncbi:galactokinase gal [Guyanagaster necrorhizus]|uniref:Galactokinase n=1 Tax=Guyanagaster necrorhizus TaxID=856835 RepID=A0A9P7W3F2_9AGAR|nr:galactokinase gal [Guyanagaster necrorhizus MCA 3950]KAG7451452.1 galactokinase gal [Guyanagaster necrorhizus MCA 3950]